MSRPKHSNKPSRRHIKGATALPNGDEIRAEVARLVAAGRCTIEPPLSEEEARYIQRHHMNNYKRRIAA